MDDDRTWHRGWWWWWCAAGLGGGEDQEMAAKRQRLLEDEQQQQAMLDELRLRVAELSHWKEQATAELAQREERYREVEQVGDVDQQWPPPHAMAVLTRA